MATEKVKVIQINTNPAQTSIKELRNQLKELRNTMLNTKQGTEEYNRALAQAAEIQHTLKEQMEYVNASAMDFGQIVSNSTKAVGSLVAGFQAVNAVMNLFGIENEEVLQSLKKMQSLMALTQSFSGIDNGIKAFKRLGIAIQGATASLSTLKKVLLTSGIGLAVAAVGLLAANWDKVTDAMKKWGIINTSTEEKLKEQKEKVEELRTELGKLEDDYEKRQKDAKVSKLNAEAKKSYDELGKSVLDYQKQLDIVAAKQKLPENQGRKRWESLAEEGKQLHENIRLLKNQQDAILANSDSYKKLDKATKETNNDAIKQREKELEEYNKNLQKKYQAEVDLRNKIKALDEQYRQEQENAENDWAEKLTPIQEQALSVVQSLRRAFITTNEQYQAEQNALKTALDNKLIAQTEYNRLSEALAKEHNDNMKVLAIQETQVWMGALQNLGSVFSSIASMMDRSTEEGQEQYKALMYTSTIISTLAGVGGAIASAFMPVNAGMTIWGQIAMAATTSASVLASGIAQLIQIKNASSTSTLGNAGGIGSISNSAVNTIQAPLEFTQAVQGANIEGAIGRRNAQKVYVTETDITDTQNKVKVSESEARF